MICHALYFFYIVLFFFMIFSCLGPQFGTHPSIPRKKLVSVLHECGNTCSLIDDLLIIKRYSDGSCNTIPVSSDDEALSKTIKEVG